MDDEIRRRMKAALGAKRLNMKQTSIAAGLGQTYLFDALIGCERNGVRRLSGRLDNFEFIAQVIRLNRRWLKTGEGPMWMDEATSRSKNRRRSRQERSARPYCGHRRGASTVARPDGREGESLRPFARRRRPQSAAGRDGHRQNRRHSHFRPRDFKVATG
jgi:hypothetical protein